MRRFNPRPTGTTAKTRNPLIRQKRPRGRFSRVGLMNCQELAFFSATVSSHALVGAVPLSGTLSSSAMIWYA